MNTKLRNQLRLNGYGSTDGGELVPHREPSHRFEHERVGLIEINAPKDLAAKVVAALDEVAALVGVSAAKTVMIFRIGKINTPPQPLQFFTDKQFSMNVSITGGPINIAAYTWANDRSPLNVRLADLPLMFPDEHHAAAEHAIMQTDGVHRGVMADELAAEKAAAERLAQTRAEIAAGYWEDSAVQAREDDKLVARYEGQHLTAFDGMPALQVLNARKRVAARRAAAERAIASTAA